MPANEMNADYARIEKAIRYLDTNRAEQPELGDVAKFVGLSPAHFQRMFTRWAGISPKRFLQHRTAQVVKRLLRENRSVLDASYEAGLSGSSRLHDLIVNAEAVSPGEYQKAGEGLVVKFGFHPSPFGECLIAVTPRGICHLAFVNPVSRGDALDRLKHDWPRAELVPDQNATRAAIASAFPIGSSKKHPPLALHIKGTNFQLKVWEALLKIPDGGVTTYGDIAESLHAPGASRAVGTAVGSNPVSWLIPCHRVIRSTGELGGYAWGIERKKVMLYREQLTKIGVTQPPHKPDSPPALLRVSASGGRRVRSA
jgi:AraC family transcriptional regulator of adaptative response/methylated-DNA-[protein]-cysteine methyltransferase